MYTLYKYLSNGGKGLSEALADLQLCGDPLRQPGRHSRPPVALVQQHNAGIVPGVADGTTDRLVDGLRAEVLVVDLPGETAVWSTGLGGCEGVYVCD